jgi:hypothetical protein
MRRLGLMVCAVLVCVFPWRGEASALERAALSLTGWDCQRSQPAIIESLERLEGVAKVEGNVIPDHLLVDHDGRRRTGDELADFINGLLRLQGRCRAAFMKSCISAGVGINAVYPGSRR